MPRSAKSEVHFLQQEVKAIELLASEIDVAPESMEDYWTLSADLINLSVDVEQFAVEVGRTDENDPYLLGLRHRLRDIAARLEGLSEV